MSSRLGEGLADQAYFGGLGDEWWSDWSDNGSVALPPPPEPIPFGESIMLTDIIKPAPPDTGAYDPGIYDPGPVTYDPGIYDPGLVAVEPADLATAVAHSTSDVLRSLPYQISQYEEDTLVAAAQSAIQDAAVTGQPVESTLGQWASSLSDTVRSLLPQVINRVLGGGTQPRAATSARGPVVATAGFNPMWLILGGLVVVVVASAAGGRRVAYARVKGSRRAPSRARRAPQRRRR